MHRRVTSHPNARELKCRNAAHGSTHTNRAYDAIIGIRKRVPSPPDTLNRARMRRASEGVRRHAQGKEGRSVSNTAMRSKYRADIHCSRLAGNAPFKRAINELVHSPVLRGMWRTSPRPGNRPVLRPRSQWTGLSSQWSPQPEKGAISGKKRQAGQSAKASIGGHAHTRLRSPKALSIRRTGGQYLPRMRVRTG